MEKKTKKERRLWRVVRPSLALSEEDENAVLASTTPLNPEKELASMPLSSAAKSRARFILRRIRKAVRLMTDKSGRFINMITFSASISSLYQLLKFCLEGTFDMPKPPDIGMFLELLKHCKVPAKCLKMFTDNSECESP